MDEPTAWLYQATADRKAAERFVADNEGTGRCHAIAKWQQTVEKAIKALVFALNNARILQVNVRPRHEVQRYVAALIRLPRAEGNRAVNHLLHGLLDQNTRIEINAGVLGPAEPSAAKYRVCIVRLAK